MRVEALARPEARVYVAEVDGAVVGYLLGDFQQRPASPFCSARRFFQVDQICVDPAVQRQGIGHRLVAAATECALAAGVRELQTVAWTFNQASLAFFEGQRFRRGPVRLMRPAG